MGGRATGEREGWMDGGRVDGKRVFELLAVKITQITNLNISLRIQLLF